MVQKIIQHLLLKYLLAHIGIKLFVPRRKQRSRHIQPLAIKTQLDHLGTSIDTFAFDVSSLWLIFELRIVSDLHSKFLSDASPQEDLTRQFWIFWIGDVILAKVTMNPA